VSVVGISKPANSLYRMAELGVDAWLKMPKSKVEVELMTSDMPEDVERCESKVR
jgi:hypothetical protein